MSRGLYIHLPFCLKKCDYCDFVSYTDCFSLQEQYKNALLREFSACEGEKISTVYLGGGTPTALGSKTLSDILRGVFDYFDVEKDAEVTVECNPKTADEEKFYCLREAGVNRLSIGVQSLDNEVLRSIGRLHTAEDAALSIMQAKRAGFLNISADLMFGLPNQTMETLQETISGLLSFDVPHISCYGLILEPNTPLWTRVDRGDVLLPDEDLEYEMYCMIYQTLKKAGYQRYEISNFAKPGYASRHNTTYWRCGEYIGCGAAAHSYYQNVRFCHTSDLKSYISCPTKREEETKLSRADEISEFMMLGLRMAQGVSKNEFFKRFGVSLDDQFGDIVKKYEACGLLLTDGDRVAFTEQGVYVSNTVLCEFV